MSITPSSAKALNFTTTYRKQGTLTSVGTWTKAVATAGNTYTNTDNLTFRVTATSGATTLTSTALMRDKVDAVSTSGDGLTLELDRSGTVAYSAVKAIN